MKFTLKSTSKYGTAYYVRDGFKQAIAVPAAQFAGGVAPDAIEIGSVPGVEASEGVSAVEAIDVKFAEKAVKVQATGIAKALKTADPAVKKAVREAGRKAERDALAAAGISL